MLRGGLSRTTAARRSLSKVDSVCSELNTHPNKKALPQGEGFFLSLKHTRTYARDYARS